MRKGRTRAQIRVLPALRWLALEDLNFSSPAAKSNQGYGGSIRQHVYRCSLSSKMSWTAARTSGRPTAPDDGEPIWFASGEVTLFGLVYRPSATGAFPAVLWNHGGSHDQAGLGDLAQAFTRRGYVLFKPFRRGHRPSPGRFTGDLLEEAMKSGGEGERSKVLALELERHLVDQLAALEFLKGLPYVDRDRIAVMGTSFGGQQAMLAAERAEGIRAVACFATAAMNWERAPDIRPLLLRAAANARVPILLIQAENDYDLAPSEALAAELSRHGKSHRRVILPAHGSSAGEGHRIVLASEKWAGEVFSFLEQALA